MDERLRIGTRGSALALAQTRQLAELLSGGDLSDSVEIVRIGTSGDRGARAPDARGDGGAGGADGGGHMGGADGDRRAGGPGTGGPGADKARWVDAIEDALLAGEIDLAVHSAKDVPGELATGLELLGAPRRAAVEDVVCVGGGEDGLEKRARRARALARAHTRATTPCGIDLLPPAARVGTSSIRRAAQLRAARADLEIVMLAGNVDTRLRKLIDPGERLDAIVLARAGLQRLGREREIVGSDAVLDPARFVPAPGQGALALQARVDDTRVQKAVAGILDGDGSACLRAERALARALGASCNTPLGAYARAAGCGCIELRAWVGLPDGSAWVADELVGGFYDPDALGARVAERMLAAGAGELLRGAEAAR
jgi:hydroxymethylbilane synthase